MNRLPAPLRALWCAGMLLAALLVQTPAHALPGRFNVDFNGQGSLVYDGTTATGAWLGTIDQKPGPAVPSPLGLLSQVSFSFDSSSGMLSGLFEMTSATDFADTLFGRIDAELLSGAFGEGGQIDVDYRIQGGTGLYAGASGRGSSLLDFMAPVGGFSDYTEDGVIAFVVSEPAPLVLSAVALLALLVTTRRRTARR